ncbi:cadherin-23-like [Haliotis cracherodii]|uniref:cadherin-23-like n=1 Tax=Haliotis cracherodii TaxID=6455 RepID=UPI0039E92154
MFGGRKGSPVVTSPLPDGSSTVNVPENTATGTVIFTVLPTTATWTYALAPAGTPFSVNIGGSVQVASALDFETAPGPHILTITVTDPADPPPTDVTLTVIVTNVYDEAPTITGTFTATTDEEVAVGTTLTVGYTVADVETANGDVLTYSLLGPDAAYFQIDATTGAISIRDRIDYDAGITSLSITVQVTDSGGNTASQAITVTVNDINDNTPVCSPSTIYGSVAENTGTGTNVASLVCTDADTTPNSDITYTIFSGDDANPNEKFALAGTAIQTTATVLDYETKSTYTLIVHAVDAPATGIPKTGTATVIVQVSAVNEADPAWGTNVPAGTAFSVSESSPLGTSIVTIAATDADLGVDGAITYQLVSTTPIAGAAVTGIFTLNAATGELTTASTLDRESVTSYTVVVRATDGGTPARSVDDTLTITITDVNDNAPVFTAASVLTGSIPESSLAGTSILTLVASDADATSTLTFSVTGGDVVPAKFEFSGTTLGQLQLANPIDLDQPTNDAGSYSLTVIVTDGGTPELTGTTYVTVTVTAVNQHTPVMNTPSPGSIVSIPENTGVGTSVATVTATDNDVGTDGTLTYAISNGNTGTAFNIDPTLGVIRTQTALDFDAGPQQYLLEVTATDGGATALIGTTTVTVDITNVNDNTPVCPSYYITQSMAEAVTATTTVTTITCTDADTADILSYTITSGNTPVFFSIVTATGEITTTAAFNYEGTREFTLTVNVSDNGAPPNSVDVTVKVLVTPVNEFDPVFAPAAYTITVLENSTIGNNVVQVTATDSDQGALDGTVRYSITGGDSQGRFTIDETTGQITLAKQLNRELVNSYTLIVTAADDVAGSGTSRAVTTSVTVTVGDANDNSPIFNPSFYTSSPIETSVALSVILTVTATDDDLAGDPNSALTYTVIAGDVTGVFEFNGADLRIAAGKNLDYATIPTFDLTIQASDAGAGPLTDTARVVIDVQPANQNSPVFTNPNQIITINESIAIGSTVLTAIASDADSGAFGTVNYTIISGNTPAGSFVIDSTTGDILVWSQLDYDIPPTFFNLTLEAKDGGGMTNTTWLYINLNDVNDNFPQFAQNVYNIAVDENLATTTSVAQIVATDADTGTNGQIDYSITSGDGQTTFAIDATTGDVTTMAALDYETKTTYNLVIQAIDRGTPTANSATTLVLITLNDLNDNTPIFTPSNFTVDLDENVAIGTSVATMAASDADSIANSNGIFTYSLTSTFFAINSTTGDITTLVAIDREVVDSHVLTVTATDQNGVGPNVGTGTLNVNVVDLNDNAPAITGTYTKTLPENTAVGTIIYTIAATDADIGRNGELSFAITVGDPTNDFTIESRSGILQLSKPLNREVTPSYTLTVTVTDNGVSPLLSVVTVSFTISDVNDNDPVFQNLPYAFSIAENVPAGSTVNYVTAIDIDTGTNGAVGYEFVIFWRGNNTHFSVNGGSGEITTNGGLDRETQDTYIIWLRASDNGVPIRSASTNVTITITDLNDNDPVFDATSYSGSVSENATIGTSILQIGTTDNDIGINAVVTLSIDTTTTAGARAALFFDISTATGDLSVKTVVDRETDSSFTFSILAVDGGATQRTSTTTVTITVTDVNDNNPVMSPSFYNTEIAYTGVCDSSITTVTASDADSGLNGQVIYYLIQSTYNYLFKVDSNTGAFSLQSQAANNFRYVIEASARDAGTPVLTAATPATIRIDTFDPNAAVVTFRLSISQATFLAQEATFIAELQTLIRVTYPSAIFRVWCVEIRSGTSGIPSTGRRKLLQTTSSINVHTYTVADSSTESVSNVNQDKTLLTSSETLQFFSTDPQGSPSSAVTGGNLNAFGITSVVPYYQVNTPWAQTPEGIAILTFIAIVILALIITGIIVTIVACRKKQRPITPVRAAKRSKRQPMERFTYKGIPQLQDDDEMYRSKSPPPAYTEKPRPMKPGQDGIASMTNSSRSRPFLSNRDFEGRAVDPGNGLKLFTLS